jgi:hypothetical protein
VSAVGAESVAAAHIEPTTRPSAPRRRPTPRSAGGPGTMSGIYQG